MSHDDDIARIASIMRGQRIAFVTSTRSDGSLHSRPMAVRDAEFNGHLWFFTDRESVKVHEIERDPQVSVAFGDIDKRRYVTFAGKAYLSDDRGRIRDLWSPVVQAWFPDGPEDPSVTLLHVTPTMAWYWDGPASRVVRAVELARAFVTGESAEKHIGISGAVEL